MKMKKAKHSLIAAAVFSAVIFSGCVTVHDLDAADMASTASVLTAGQTTAVDLEAKYGAPSMTAKTQDGKTLVAYMFNDTSAAWTNFIPFNYTSDHALTQKHLFALFGEDGKLINSEFCGIFCIEHSGFGSSTSFVHPLTAEQLNRKEPMTIDEGKESYYQYLMRKENKSRDQLTDEELDGNEGDFKVGYDLMLLQAEDFAGKLTDIQAH